MLAIKKFRMPVILEILCIDIGMLICCKWREGKAKENRRAGEKQKQKKIHETVAMKWKKPEIFDAKPSATLVEDKDDLPCKHQLVVMS